MTEIEAKGFVQGKLDCMKKCDIFNKEDNTSDAECDNCEYCYSQGNFGNQKEAFQMAINALEKQIPKKPIEMKPTDKLMNGYYSCPICGDWVGMDEYSNNYCANCGQVIDWSDEE